MASLDEEIGAPNVEEVEAPNVVVEEVPVNNNEVRPHKRVAKCWKNYTCYIDKNGKEKAKCNRCKKDYAIGSSSHGTRNLNEHLKKCFPATRGDQDVGQAIMNVDMSLRSRKFSQEIYREKMAMAIMRHNYPFMIVEHDGLQAVHSYLNHDVKTYTRNTAKADCVKIYKREKELLKDVLASIPGRISLTSDVWSSLVTEGYICLTAHYVDNDWVLRSKILNFCHFPPPHSGPLLSEKVFEFLKEWGIEKKLFTLTLDNARSCNNMQDILKSRLQNNLICGGEFFHVRCSAHILNLIVQDGLKVASVALHKVRESVKYIKGSEGRKIKFAQCCEQFGVTQNYLRQDVPTRWNYTYLMLDCALKFRRVFAHFAMIELGYDQCPTVEEWDRAAKICRFLQPFHDITKLFSGSEYPTANLYFENVWIIQLRLLEEAKGVDLVVRDMARNMLPKFEKYWEDYSLILSMAIVLDPRFKIQFVRYCYAKINETTCDEKVLRVKVAMTSLFQAYASQYMVQAPQEVPNTTCVGDTSNAFFRDETLDFDSFEACDSTKSELDKYLDEPRFDRRDHPHMSILKFWKDNSGRYPILSTMARDIMSIPITTVASESTFSIGGKVLTKLRSSLTPENAQVCVCGRNWTHGYYVQSDEPIEEQLIVPLPIGDSAGSTNNT